MARGLLPARSCPRRTRVDCKPGSVPARRPVRTIPLGAALLRRSSALTRTPGPGASGGPPSAASLFELAPEGACPTAGHPAVARGLLPHDFTLACASPAGSSRGQRDRRPSAVSFLWRFPSGHPGSPLATFPPCGARTFLPRAMAARRRSSVHLPPGIYPPGATGATGPTEAGVGSPTSATGPVGPPSPVTMASRLTCIEVFLRYLAPCLQSSLTPALRCVRLPSPVRARSSIRWPGRWTGLGTSGPWCWSATCSGGLEASRSCDSGRASRRGSSPTGCVSCRRRAS